MKDEIINLIVDTDTGVDDTLALFLLKGNKNIKIELITTVQGNSTIENVTTNALFVKNLININAPLYAGSDRPLVREPIYSSVHGEYSLGDISIPESTNWESGAVEKIIEVVNKKPGEVVILALGPLTNIAKALGIDPNFANKVKKIVIMGGAVRVPGNMANNSAEFNFLCDPDAASIVLSSQLDKIIIPLDVCNKVAMYEREFDELKSEEIYETLMKLIRPYIKLLKEVDGLNGAVMYDPVAAYYLINPNAFESEDLNLEISIDKDNEYGKVSENNSDTNKTKVCLAVDREKFVSDFNSSIKHIY